MVAGDVLVGVSWHPEIRLWQFALVSVIEKRLRSKCLSTFVKVEKSWGSLRFEALGINSDPQLLGKC